MASAAVRPPRTRRISVAGVGLLVIASRTGGTAPGPIDESVYSSKADRGSDFRIADCGYHYNVAAIGLGAGTYLAEDPDRRLARGPGAVRGEVSSPPPHQRA